MKQPDSLDAGTQMDVARYRLQTAKEDLNTANLTFSSEQLLALSAEEILRYLFFYIYHLKSPKGSK